MSVPSLFRRESPLGPFRRAFDAGEYELYEDDGEFVLAVELPGYDAEDIDLTWDDQRLTVSARRDTDRGERAYHRTFRFPRRVDGEDIAAEYRNGVLEVRLPVAGDTSLPGRTIPVEA